MNHNQKDVKDVPYFFPLHLKLLAVILVFLVFLTTLFSVSLYLSERNRLLNDLAGKKDLLKALIINPYSDLPETMFLDYLNENHIDEALKIYEVTNFLIIDANDKVVFSNYQSDISLKIVKYISEKSRKSYLKEKGGYSNFSNMISAEYQTYDYQLYIEHLGNYDGIFYASTSLDQYHKGMSKFFLLTLIVSLIIFFISTVIFLYSIKVITKPIRLLKNAAEKVTRGDLDNDNKVLFYSDDEIGFLARSFNEMTEKLKMYNEMQIDQIKTLNEDLLEKNRELEGSYEEIEASNEELETTNEELIATNEELEIANRDLFSMAQDLRSSKDDLEKNMNIVNTANEELKVINRMKTNFLGMASHELKTPLVMIKGYAELILDTKDTALDKNIKEMLTHILKGADTLNSIIRDMLDITKIEAKELKLHIVPVELKLVIDTVILEMQDTAKKRGQTLNIGVCPKVSALVDAPQIHRVLIHLIANAIKFTPDNGKISIYAGIRTDNILSSMYNLDSDIDFVDIVVEDTGIGIDKSEQEKIFDVFYEIGDIDHHRSSKSAYLGKGSGLGLTICKGIVEAHKGRIWVESEEVNLNTFPGSKFHVLLPMKPLETRAVKETKKITEDEIKTPSVEVEQPKKIKTPKPRILLIEDEADIVKLTTLILEEKFTIETSDNGADGIKKAFEFKPNLILMDIYMKGLTGYEVCSILKSNEKTKNIPIAMFTAGTQKYEIEKGYKVGVDDYITKPFNPIELVERVEKIIEKSEKKSEKIS